MAGVMKSLNGSVHEHYQELELARQPVELARISQLMASDGPRLKGVNNDHARTLAESGQELPPITVQRGTMRVIDGMHRVAAALMRGDEYVKVLYFDGTDDNAFLVAVIANAKHGLPLSLADRTAAAARIIVTRPDWSDRAIGSAVGLEHKTVAAVRHRVQQEDAAGVKRRGRDGRLRPVSAVEGRRRAAEILAGNPGATLQELSTGAGIALATAKDVRDRVQRGEDPLASSQRSAPPDWQAGTDLDGAGATADIERTCQYLQKIVHTLQRDPSLWQNELSRKVLRMLGSHSLSSEEWQSFISTAPLHCSAALAAAVRTCTEYLAEVERLLQRQADALP
jgi:ParB-like chromosome segregation protein Spo0J